MAKTRQHVFYGIAGLLMLALFAGCGSSSSTTTVPSSATIFYAHSLAFRNSTTMAWGYNGFGQIGNGSLNNPITQPVAVSGLIGAKGVAIGADHSLAFFNNSTVRAWGDNYQGQLGNNTTNYSSVPVSVKANVTPTLLTNLTGVTAVAAGGFHSLALRNDGTVWAWGENTNGQLGIGTTANSLTAQAVSTGQTGVASITAIAAGGSHSLALRNDGTVWAWGYNGRGQLGNDTTTDSLVPVQVVLQSGNNPIFLTNITAIAAGGAFSVALKNDGTVWVWGYNGFGQLGNNSTTDSNVPVQVVMEDKTPLINIKAISAGLDHVLALDVNGKIWAWGYNGLGQLGDNTTINRSTPVKVKIVTDSSTTPVQVQDFAAALITSPFTVDGVSPILAVGHHSLARQSDGKLYAWGDNAYGQLGFAPPSNLDTFRTTPQPVGNGM